MYMYIYLYFVCSALPCYVPETIYIAYYVVICVATLFVYFVTIVYLLSCLLILLLSDLV